MRAVWIDSYGGPGVLSVRETPDPEPGPGEIRVRVRAAGLNFAEVTARMGLYPDAPKPPCVVGYEAAGVVDAVGAGVAEGPAVGPGAGPAVGDRVLVLTRFGGHADTVCVPAGQAFPMPAGMSFEQAAALPVNYLTAHHALFRIGGLRPGERVLVHMAAGGVGLAVLQLCRTVADVVAFGTASASKHEALRAAGCTHPIDYRTRDYVREVRALTGGEGVDLVLDALGGRDWRRGYRLLRPTGRLVALGFANVAGGERRNPVRLVRQLLNVPLFTPLGLMNHNRSVAGVNIGHLWDHQEILADQMRAVLTLFEQGAIAPQVDSVFSFADAGAAHRRIQARQNVGKVLLVP